MSDIVHPVIYKDDDVELFLETHPYWKLLIHCYVTNWSKSKYEDFVLIWTEFLDQIDKKGFDKIHAAIRPCDDRLRKFASMFGFKPTGVYLKDNRGDERLVFECLI